jgi:hypothetical protein
VDELLLRARATERAAELLADAKVSVDGQRWEAALDRFAEMEELGTDYVNEDGHFEVVRYEGADRVATLVPRTATGDLNVEGFNLLTIRAEGTSYQLGINGVVVAEFDDDELDAGQVGLALDLAPGDTAFVAVNRYLLREPGYIRLTTAAALRVVAGPRAVSRLAGSVVVFGVTYTVVLGANDVESLVELHVDLAPVVERDLDFIEALLIADLGIGHCAFAEMLEGGSACLLERIPGDRGVGVVSAGRQCDASAGQRGDEDRNGCDQQLAALHHRSFRCGVAPSVQEGR